MSPVLFWLLGFWLIVSVLLNVSAEIQTFVVPKNKTAKQSTNYTQNENPKLGNDGNRDGTYSAGVRCVAGALNDPLPWWLVDMDQDYLIFGAAVWNRIDGPCAPRFTHISIGVTSNPSIWTNFNLSLFDLCMYWPGKATNADNPINFFCSRPLVGRYLAVYKNNTAANTTDLFFHFCEIDILAVSKSSSSSVTGTAMQPEPSATRQSLLNPELAFARSDAECLWICRSHSTCWYALFRPAKTECWMFGSQKLNSSFMGIYNEGGASFLVLADTD